MDNIWEFDLLNEKWTMFANSGAGPNGIYGHSTVYHEQTQTFYVFGGYVYKRNGTAGSRISDRLYALHYPTRVWTILPAFYEFSAPPSPRFLHSAIATDNFMLVLGGQYEARSNPLQYLFAYSFTCNQWIKLLEGKHVVGSPPLWTYGQDMALDPETGEVFVVGGFTGAVVSHVTRISLPDDLCNLWEGKDACRLHLGCSYCAVKRGDGPSASEISSACYSTPYPMPEPCKYPNHTLYSNNGVHCDMKWLNARACSLYHSCSECAVRWPSYWDEDPACQWDAKNCVPFNGTVSECEVKCFAPDCEKCLERDSCSWGATGCVADNGIESYCPPLCGDFSDCASCLSTPDCRWSVNLQECISPVHQPLYCAGGACGLVLREGLVNECPEQCSNADQCSTCLRLVNLV